MGEFGIYQIAWLLFLGLPFIMFVVRPPKSGILRHFIGWYVTGFAGFLIIFFIGVKIDEHTAKTDIEEPTTVSQPAPQVQKETVRWI